VRLLVDFHYPFLSSLTLTMRVALLALALLPSAAFGEQLTRFVMQARFPTFFLTATIAITGPSASSYWYVPCTQSIMHYVSLVMPLMPGFKIRAT
jgi:hypothetical protein